MTAAPQKPMALDVLNTASITEAAEILLPVVELSPWLGNRVLRARPFSNREDMVKRIAAIIHGLGREESLRLLRAHRVLRPHGPTELSTPAHQEHQWIGLTQLSQSEAVRLADLNALYQKRFGYPFIIALPEHAAMDSVFAALEARLQAGAQDEVQDALDQVISIIKARVYRTFAPVRAAVPGSDTARARDGAAENVKQFLLQLSRSQDASRPPHAWVGALGGATLAIVALVFIIGGFDLDVGSARRLGPGAFPVITGIVLLLLAIPIMIIDLRDDRDAEKPDWISFLAIGAAIGVFALSAERLGLVPAAFLATVISSGPDPTLSVPGKLILGTIVGLGCWVLFIVALDLPFKPFVGL